MCVGVWVGRGGDRPGEGGGGGPGKGCSRKKK